MTILAKQGRDNLFFLVLPDWRIGEMVQKENNQKRPDSQTKDAEEGDFGTGSRSFYEAPYWLLYRFMHPFF